ncbi:MULTISPECIES: hypothetical protein [Kitasatospora]|uniref:Uncharacterized protein n=2 Tax=Kitasatospora TaxID=2063 RepID=A0ABT1J180_9ACTN|nr:hypothetical protein [Kitasatospora paracochleata]MCP2311195.1 hypothetical protein [Kitasatospora paracochleata]
MRTDMETQWAGPWAAHARAAGGGLVGNLLADLADDVPRGSSTVVLLLPLGSAAAALRTAPADLPAALGRLAAAGLLSYRLDGRAGDEEYAEVTLHPAVEAARAG